MLSFLWVTCFIIAGTLLCVSHSTDIYMLSFRASITNSYDLKYKARKKHTWNDKEWSGQHRKSVSPFNLSKLLWMVIIDTQNCIRNTELLFNQSKMNLLQSFFLPKILSDEHQVKNGHWSLNWDRMAFSGKKESWIMNSFNWVKN